MVGMAIAPPGAGEVPEDHEVNRLTAENSPGGTFADITAAAFKVGPVPSLLSTAEHYIDAWASDDASMPKLTPAEAKKQYGAVVDEPTTVQDAMWKAGRQQAQRDLDAASQNAGFWKNLGAQGAAFVADPLDLATFFIPIGGEAMVASRLGLGATAAGRATARAIAGGATLAAAQLPITAAEYGTKRAADIPFTIADALREELFAFGAGAIAHPLLGAASDAFKGAPEWAKLQEAKFAEKESAARAGIAQMVQEKPIDVEPVFNADERSASNTNFETYSREQRQLEKEGTVLGLPQETLRSVVQDVADAASAPMKPPAEQLADLRTRADDMESLLKDAHGESAEFTEHLDKIAEFKEQSAMFERTYKALATCLTKG